MWLHLVPSFKPCIHSANLAVVHRLSAWVAVFQALNMDDLLFEVNVTYLELAGFRRPEPMAKHEQQKAIVTLPVAGKSFFAARIQKLLDFVWSQVFSGSFSSGMVHARFV